MHNVQNDCIWTVSEDKKGKYPTKIIVWRDTLHKALTTPVVLNNHEKYIE